MIDVFTTFENRNDSRVARTRDHELFDIIVVSICATIASSDNWADIERFGDERLDRLKTFLPLKNGVPSHDTFGRVFSRLDPAKLSACVTQWMDDVGPEIGQHIAIDGKTLRGSFDNATKQTPFHLVSAWACEARLTLGQVATDAKSNEITAIPLLLELLDLKGSTVTIDAMGCQKEIASKIIECEADYVLAFKDNHPKLSEAVEEAFEAALEDDAKQSGLRRHRTEKTSHGREECRQYFAMPAPRTLPGFASWANLMTIVMVVRTTIINGQERGEISYFLSILPAKVKNLAKLIRQHSSIENQLHWVLDVTFTEDASRIRKDQAPQTSAILRRLAVSILSQDTSTKDNIRGKRYRASMSTDVLERILLGFAEK